MEDIRHDSQRVYRRLSTGFWSRDLGGRKIARQLVLESDTAVNKVTASSMLIMDWDSYVENGSARREREKEDSSLPV